MKVISKFVAEITKYSLNNVTHPIVCCVSREKRKHDVKSWMLSMHATWSSGSWTARSPWVRTTRYQMPANTTQEMMKEVAKLSKVQDQGRSIMEVKKSLRNLCDSWFSSALLYVFNRPCFETTRFRFEWAWITPRIPNFRAKGFHLHFDNCWCSVGQTLLQPPRLACALLCSMFSWVKFPTQLQPSVIHLERFGVFVALERGAPKKVGLHVPLVSPCFRET